MTSYHFLMDLAIILLSTKLMGLLTQRFHLPQVVGALVAGLLLGPACLGILQETDFIKSTAEIGVIVLMFCAGLETDVEELKRSGKASLVIALLGVLVPLFPLLRLSQSQSVILLFRSIVCLHQINHQARHSLFNRFILNWSQLLRIVL